MPIIKYDFTSHWLNVKPFFIILKFLSTTFKKDLYEIVDCENKFVSYISDFGVKKHITHQM